jgi:hypothetical protein
MDIDYNKYANEFEITLSASEFKALREFMKLAAVVTLWDRPFRNDHCNIIDKEISEQGKRLAKKLNDFYCEGRADNEDDHDQLIKK